MKKFIHNLIDLKNKICLKKTIRIAIMSVADIKNYGDMLFPFISRQEISKRIKNAEFRFFTPTECIIENEKFYKYSYDALYEYFPDVILVIGGEVIHKYDNTVWQEMYHNKIDSPSKIIFDWLTFPCKFKAWFSVGALFIDDIDEVFTINKELKHLNYIGVRGILSKKILENRTMMYHNPNINIVPDIGWIFPNYFKNSTLKLKKIAKHYNFKLNLDKYIVFNVNFTSIPQEKIVNILNLLSEFAKEKKLNIVMINVISSYKNIDFNIEEYCKNNNILYLDNLTLNETGALLMNCRFFIGSSLHCAITSLASGKPAGLIHSDCLTKFQDLYEHAMMSDLLSNNWDTFETMLYRLYNFDSERKKVLYNYVIFMQSCFYEKLNNLLDEIKGKIK